MECAEAGQLSRGSEAYKRRKSVPSLGYTQTLGTSLHWKRLKFCRSIFYSTVMAYNIRGIIYLRGYQSTLEVCGRKELNLTSRSLTKHTFLSHPQSKGFFR